MLIPKLFARAKRAAVERGYTDQALAAQLDYATLSANDAAQLAAAVFGAGLVGRSLAAATVEADPVIGAALPASSRDMIGRALVLGGELFFDVRTRGGLRLVPALFADATGGPERYVYKLQVASPRGYLPIRRPWSAVLAFFWARNPRFPWRGEGPLTAARLSTGLAAAVESKLSGEISKSVAGSVLPVPFGETDMRQFRTNLAAAKKGGLFTSPSMASGFGAGAVNSGGEYRTIRLGARPDPQMTALRSPAAAAVLQAIGIQPGMLSLEDGSGQLAREAYRQFAHSVIEPLCELLSEELSLKFEREVRIVPKSFGNADLQARARAARSLTQAGAPLEQALRLCGFE
ncbi:MAG: phage portal protein [Chloroflexi bacterium]|nr:phage portal protein [Chloroflexota bacterium]